MHQSLEVRRVWSFSSRAYCFGNWNCYLDCGNFKEYPSRLAVPVEIRVPQIMEKIAVPPAMPHHFCIIISTLRLLLYRDILPMSVKLLACLWQIYPNFILAQLLFEHCLRPQHCSSAGRNLADSHMGSRQAIANQI